MDVAITELEKIDAERVDGVAAPASGIPILLMKSIGDGEAVKDWAAWDAANQGSGRPSAPGPRAAPPAKGNGKAATPSAFARAKQTIADHKAGKEVSAADLKNAHDVHEAHLAHLAHEADLKADAGAKPAAKASGDDAVDCPTCEGDGKMRGNSTDCPDCDAKGKVTPARAKTLAAKSLARGFARSVITNLSASPADLLKAVGADGGVDEAPDIDKANQILALLGEAIAAEAQEMASGQAGEADDIMELACASQAVRRWRDGEQAVSLGDVMPASMLMQSAAVPTLNLNLSGADDWTPEQWSAWQADLEKAVSDGMGATVTATFTKAAKGAIAQEDTSVDTVTQGTGDLNKAVEAAIAKATAPLEKLRKELEETLAKVRATPVPGGPVLSRNVQVKQPGGVVREDWAAKAAYYRDMAEQVNDRETADGYRSLARAADSKAVTPPAS